MTTNDAENSNVERADLPALEIRRLCDDCRRSAFHCGNDDIDKWFKTKSLKHHNAFRCRVVTAHFPNNTAPVGFYAMGYRMEKVSDLPSSHRSSFSWWTGGGEFPVVHLQYVAVQKAMQRRGFGTIIMGSALDDFYEVAVRTGIFALTLTAVDEKTADFYRKLGFTDFGSSGATQPRLILPADVVIELRAGRS